MKLKDHLDIILSQIPGGNRKHIAAGFCGGVWAVFKRIDNLSDGDLVSVLTEIADEYNECESDRKTITLSDETLL